MTYKVLLHRNLLTFFNTSTNTNQFELYGHQTRLYLMFHLPKLLQLLVRSAFLPQLSGIAYHQKSESHLRSLNSCADSRGISFNASFADHSYPAPLYHRLKWHWIMAPCINSVIDWLIKGDARVWVETGIKADTHTSTNRVVDVT